MHGNFVRRGVCLLGIAAALISGCSMANFGSARPSADVTRQFQDLEINPNYRYWYLNQENNPFGVLGIDREYRFDGGPLWTPLDPDAAKFKKVVGLVQSFPMQGSYTSGFEITDPQGRQIGVWYSSLNAGVTVDSAAKAVSVTTPTPWTKPYSLLLPDRSGDLSPRVRGDQLPGAADLTRRKPTWPLRAAGFS